MVHDVVIAAADFGPIWATSQAKPLFRVFAFDAAHIHLP